MPDENQPDDTALGTQSAALEVGLRVLRQYVLKRFLGRGSLGSAWLVVHEGIGRQLTMRFLPESWLHNEQVIERLREAVVRLLEITHPGIVGILDFVRDPQAAAIVSRFVEGESAVDAKALSPQRCFEVDKLRPWLTQLCEALDFAWRRSEAFHGDLCPANLLITPLGDLKVSDFGLARCLYDLKSPTGDPLLVMPPVFSSPERLRGEPATVADDVFGFGASVFDLITSKPPFSLGSTEVPPRMAERRAALGIGGELIPPEWEEVIAACLAPVAADRPRSLREAGERLGVLAPLPEGADRPPQPTVLPRPHETVVGYRPPSTRPAVVYPSSEVTAAMEPPTMHGHESSDSPPTELMSELASAPAEIPPSPAEPAPEPTPEAPVPAASKPAPEPEQEAAPATIDETFDFEETMAEVPPPASTASAAAAATIVPDDDDASATIAADPTPPPAPAPSPFVPPPPSQPQPTLDDASATMTADPTPPPVPVPATEPGPAMVEEDYEKTVAEVRPPPITPPPPPATPPPSPAPAPPPPSDIPKNLEDSVTMPAAKRPAYTPAPPPMPPPREMPASTPTPAPPRSIPLWVFAAAGVVVLAAVAVPFALRKGDPEPAPVPAADPTPIAVVATPEPATPPPIPATPTPTPATPTPAPTPPPMAGRLVQAEELIASSTEGPVSEALLLTGSFRVSTVVPPRPGEGANVVMRPADTASSGKLRVIVKLAPSTVTPSEGGTLTLDASSRYFIREVRHGADGQVNLQVEQR